MIEAGQVSGKLTMDDSQFVAAMENAVKKAGELGTKLTDASKSFSGFDILSNQAQQFSGVISSMTARFSELQGVFDTLSTKFVELDHQAQSASTNFQTLEAQAARVGRSCNALGQNLSTVGKGLTAITIPIMGVLYKAYGFLNRFSKQAETTGKTFEATMMKIKGVTGATENQLKQLTQAAKELAQDLPTSAQEMAAAIQTMAARGNLIDKATGQIKDIEKVKESLKTITEFSIATGTSVQKSVNLMMSTTRNFAKQMEDEMISVTDVTDMFTKAINSSNLTVDGLTTAMMRVGKSAAASGVGVAELTAHIQLLADAGIQSNRASTGLMQYYEKLRMGAEKVGISTKTATGGMRDMDAIMGDFAAKYKGDESILEKVFGKSAQAKMIAQTMINGIDTIRAKTDELKASTGAASKAVDAQGQTYERLMNSYGTALETLQNTVWKQIEGQKKNMLSAYIDIFESINKYVEKTGVIEKATASFFQGLGLNMKDLSGSFSEMLNQIDPKVIIDGAKQVGEVIKNIYDAIMSIINTIPWRTLANYIGPLIKFGAGAWISSKVLDWGKALAGTFTSVTDGLRGFVGIGTSVVDTLINGFGGVSKSVEGLGKVSMQTSRSLIEQFTMVQEAGILPAKKSYDDFVKGLTVSKVAMKEAMAKGISPDDMENVGRKAWDAWFKPVDKNMLAFKSDMTKSTLQALMDARGPASKEMSSFMKLMTSNVSDVFASMGNGLKNLFSAQNAQSLMEGFRNVMNMNITELFTGLGNSIKNLGTGIMNAISGIKDLPFLVKAADSAFVALVNGPIAALGAVAAVAMAAWMVYDANYKRIAGDAERAEKRSAFLDKHYEEVMTKVIKGELEIDDISLAVLRTNKAITKEYEDHILLLSGQNKIRLDAKADLEKQLEDMKAVTEEAKRQGKEMLGGLLGVDVNVYAEQYQENLEAFGKYEKEMRQKVKEMEETKLKLVKEGREKEAFLVQQYIDQILDVFEMGRKRMAADKKVDIFDFTDASKKIKTFSIEIEDVIGHAMGKGLDPRKALKFAEEEIKASIDKQAKEIDKGDALSKIRAQMFKMAELAKYGLDEQTQKIKDIKNQWRESNTQLEKNINLISKSGMSASAAKIEFEKMAKSVTDGMRKAFEGLDTEQRVNFIERMQKLADAGGNAYAKRILQKLGYGTKKAVEAALKPLSDDEISKAISAVTQQRTAAEKEEEAKAAKERLDQIIKDGQKLKITREGIELEVSEYAMRAAIDGNKDVLEAETKAQLERINQLKKDAKQSAYYREKLQKEFGITVEEEVDPKELAKEQAIFSEEYIKEFEKAGQKTALAQFEGYREAITAEFQEMRPIDLPTPRFDEKAVQQYIGQTVTQVNTVFKNQSFDLPTPKFSAETLQKTVENAAGQIKDALSKQEFELPVFTITDTVADKSAENLREKVSGALKKRGLEFTFASEEVDLPGFDMKADKVQAVSEKLIDDMNSALAAGELKLPEPKVDPNMIENKAERISEKMNAAFADKTLELPAPTINDKEVLSSAENVAGRVNEVIAKQKFELPIPEIDDTAIKQAAEKVVTQVDMSLQYEDIELPVPELSIDTARQGAVQIVSQINASLSSMTLDLPIPNMENLFNGIIEQINESMKTVTLAIETAFYAIDLTEAGYNIGVSLMQGIASGASELSKPIIDGIYKAVEARFGKDLAMAAR